MSSSKKDVTPLLTHWSYNFLALSHRYILLSLWWNLPGCRQTVTSTPQISTGFWGSKGSSIMIWIFPILMNSNFEVRVCWFPSKCSNWKITSYMAGKDNRQYTCEKTKLWLISSWTKWLPIDNKPALVQSKDLVPNRRQAITWTNNGPVYWHIYAAPGGEELKPLFIWCP